jgi:hypothetical protein
MTRRLIAITVVVAGGAVAVAALAAGERGEDRTAAPKPRLNVDSFTPLVVYGTGFRAGENVRFMVRGAAAGSARQAKASAGGRISMRFPGVSLDQCPSFLIITAIGDKGSRAQLRRMPPACGIDPGRAR